MEGVSVVEENSGEQGVALGRLGDAAVEQGERLAGKKRWGNGEEVCLITCLFVYRCLGSIKEAVMTRD